MAFIQILAAVGTYFVTAVAGMKALAMAGISLKEGVKGQVTVRQTAVALVINAIIALLIVAEEIAFSGSLRGFRIGVDTTDVVLAALGGFGTLAAARAYAGLLKAKPSRPTAGLWLGILMLAALFMGALMEEILFRAFIIGRLASLGWLSALLISSLIFTLIHLPTSRLSLRSLLAWLLGGLALGGAWISGAPLLVVTLLHFARNAGNVIWVDPLPQLGLVTLPSTKDSTRIIYYTVISVLVIGLAAIGYRRW